MGLEELAGKVPIVAVMGPKFSGKSIIAEALTHQGFTRFAFADKLKEAAMLIYGLAPEQVYGVLKEVIDPRYGIAPRFILQRLATEVCRIIHPDTWILALERQVLWSFRDRYSEIAIVIDDLRYLNEVEYIRRWGGIIWEVRRVGNEYSGEHSSEERLSIEPSANLLNDGTPEDLAQLAVQNWEVEKLRWQTRILG